MTQPLSPRRWRCYGCRAVTLDDETWPDGLTTLDLPAPAPDVPWDTRPPEPRDLSGEPARDPGDPRWAHVDVDHPAPWLGCIRRNLCCRNNPGWFSPGEAERAAELLGLDLATLVNRFLVVDHVDLSVGRVEVYAPAKLGRDGLPVEPPGGKTSDLYRFSSGSCVFFDGAGCAIYEARPRECRGYCCVNLPEDNASRLDLALLWLEASGR